MEIEKPYGRKFYLTKAEPVVIKINSEKYQNSFYDIIADSMITTTKKYIDNLIFSIDNHKLL